MKNFLAYLREMVNKGTMSVHHIPAINTFYFANYIYLANI
jgi:hypothetical protein